MQGIEIVVGGSSDVGHKGCTFLPCQPLRAIEKDHQHKIAARAEYKRRVGVCVTGPAVLVRYAGSHWNPGLDEAINTVHSHPLDHLPFVGPPINKKF